MALDSPNAAFLRERPVVPLPPLLSPSACIFSHHGEGSSLTSLISTLRYIRNNAAKTAPVRRWLDEDYDYDAPEEVARRNQVFEAFARRVAAIESAEAGIGLQSHIEEDTEYADGTRETIGMQLCDVGRKATGRKLCVKKPVSLATTTSRRPSHSQTKTSDSSPRHLKETSDLQAREKRVPDDQTETVPTAIRAGEHPLSKFQVQEFEMVRAYLAKRAAHFEWVSTSSHGLEPLPYPNDIPLSNDIIAYRFELAYDVSCSFYSS
ncbi:hypothetical protein DICSQDRAFT_175235 [Dichomitus squalens LYAD-421 SS1]|uniref:Uncharacterized protein n=2 Tax=Dichomitus squalens TaxID=114155 RepID=A0A4Q9PKT0_9APHY|nr:uncharacterized protein DICSQDRAFT_175235 [Dichomitus squalens LYAD-421 SS1]EJF56081.1 hypothetical protein DICSQDRAFT_175235 [Dichomitus squalens LYAD-421 SS1]TBU54734.1 hypothetical protein BD310DRAFT_885621 [Dichomitus squalens]